MQFLWKTGILIWYSLIPSIIVKGVIVIYHQLKHTNNDLSTSTRLPWHKYKIKDKENGVRASPLKLLADGKLKRID